MAIKDNTISSLITGPSFTVRDRNIDQQTPIMIKTENISEIWRPEVEYQRSKGTYHAILNRIRMIPFSFQ